jgi:hypothetical protein
MSKNYAEIAEAYYTAVGKKDVVTIEKHLHPDVQFSSPFAKLAGKAAVLEATKGFAAFFKTLYIRASFGSEDQAVVIYDVDCPPPVGKVSAAALLTFQDALVAKIELFFDPRPFDA